MPSCTALHCTEITHPPSTRPSVPLTPSKPKRARHEHGSCHCHCHCHAGPDQPANGPLQQGASGRPAGRTTPHPPTRGATATGTHEPARQALCAVARGRSRSRPRRAGVHQFPTVLRMRRAGGGGVKRKAASIKPPWRPPARRIRASSSLRERVHVPSSSLHSPTQAGPNPPLE